MHAPNGSMPEHASAAPLIENDVANAQPTPEKAAKPPPPKKEQPPKEASKMAGGAKRAAPGAARKAEGGLQSGAPSASESAMALEVTELKMSVENLERERDFYYSKLREVEVLCQTHEGQEVPFLQQVLDILYKTDDQDEFVTPDEADVTVQ